MQKILPDWMVILLMAVILGYTAYRTYGKASATYKKEKEALAQQRRLSVATQGIEDSRQLKLEQIKLDHVDEVGNHPSAEASEVDEEAGEITVSTQYPERSSPSSPEEPEREKSGISMVSPDGLVPTTRREHGEDVGNDDKLRAGGNGGYQKALDEDTSPSTPSVGDQRRSHDLLHSRPPSGEPAAACRGGSSPPVLSAGVKGNYSQTEWLEKVSARPTKQYFYLFGLWTTLLLILLFKGGKGLESVLTDAIPYCGGGYWAMTALAFVWLFGFGAVMGRRAVSKSVRKQEVGFPFVEGDVLWDGAKLKFYAFWTFMAGVVFWGSFFHPRDGTRSAPERVLSWSRRTIIQRLVSFLCEKCNCGLQVIAGLIGIGGGMVLGPLMLQMGVLPQVAGLFSVASMDRVTRSIFVSSSHLCCCFLALKLR